MSPTTDRQTLMVRRSIAAGAGLVVLLLLVVGVRGCLDARKEGAFKDYVRDVGALVAESDQQSQALFRLLSSDEGDVDVLNALNMLRQQAEVLVERASGTDHPDELGQAERYLVEALELRRDGLGGIADALPAATAPQQERRQGTRKIAEQMQLLLASDVVYLQRVVPNLERPLREEGLVGEAVRRSEFLPNVDWLQPETVADRVGKLGGGGGGRKGPAAPGLHGNSLAGVTLGGQALSAGSSVNVRLTDDLELQAQIANQGENTETDVKVNVTIGKGGDEIALEEVLDEIAAGETKTVTIPIAERPPTGQNVPIAVEVEAVPGEDKTDNNKGQFSAIFTG
ncbi:MAG: hypothetical protein M3131_02905 [Actinomycetota bacterium]|nr:hypothetical protein [Actinomycetota bacterium]